MPEIGPTHRLPTIHRIRAWFGGDGDVPVRHLRSSLLGIIVIVAVGVGFLYLSFREHAAESERSTALSALRIATEAENHLANIETAHRGFLLTGQKQFLDQFERRRGALRDSLIALVPLLAENRQLRDEVRNMSSDFERWLNDAGLPQIQARQQAKTGAAVAPIDRGDVIMSDLRTSASRTVRAIGDEYNDAGAFAKIQRVLQTAGFALLSVLAIGFLVTSSWSGYVAFRRHLRKLEAAHAQTRSIIATTLDGVITADDQGRILSMNPAAERMFAQSGTALIGQSISILIPQRLIFHEMSKLTRGTMMAVGQRQGYYPFPIEISLSEMLVGGRKQFVALIRDVTERKTTEETLKHIGLGVSGSTGEEFVRSLVKQLSKALRNDYAFLVEISGHKAGKVTTLTISAQGSIQFSEPTDLRLTACGEALTKGFRIIESGVRMRFPEDPTVAKLGIESFIGMPLVDHRGRTVGLMGVMDKKPLVDTQVIESTLQIFAARAAAEIERKQFEADLAEEKERLAVTLRSIGDGFITIDNEGRVLMLNPVAEQMTGWEQSSAAGRPLAEVFDLINEKTQRRCQHAIARIVEHGSSDVMPPGMLLKSKGGDECMVECTTSPIRDKGNRKVGAVIVFRDVTERHRALEERQKAEKLESLGVVAGGIAHDFNNLLTAILGNLSLALLIPDIEGKMSDRLTAAKKATNRAQELAQQLLTFAKGGAPVKQLTSIGKLVHDTASFTLHGSKATCHFGIPDGLWPVEIDPGQMSQVINNIVANADQAMPAGGSLRVSGENLELLTNSPTLGLRAGRWVRISVHDEGVGIPEEYMAKIFDPYFTTKPKGTGLGLATAYSIVKGHGGIIGVDSKPGEGSTFSVCLPASEKSLPAASLLAAHAPPGRSRVLILDDEEAICMIVNCALSDLGYEVTETYDGEQAIEAYREALNAGRRFDVVISDLTIPGGTGGQETIRRLREIDPEVCAIVSSGYANDPVMSNFEEYGFSGMIAKPYEIDALGRKVAEVLNAPRAQKMVFHDFANLRLA
jgi:PAS domain S-box-containing protein